MYRSSSLETPMIRCIMYLTVRPDLAAVWAPSYWRDFVMKYLEFLY